MLPIFLLNLVIYLFIFIVSLRGDLRTCLDLLVFVSDLTSDGIRCGRTFYSSDYREFLPSVYVRFVNFSTNYEVVYNIYSISIEILIRGLENPSGAGLWVRLERFRDIFQDPMWKI